ncbi:MAG: TVP38/TMEM64 family protein [Spirochaetota bacterium]|nr:TVP38/TMEM64 family protein [Spirochaetota bacterium]
MKKYQNIIIFLILFGLGIFVLTKTGVASQLSLENIPKLKEQFLSLGWIAFIIYFFAYIIVCIFFLPGSPLTILGGVVFGPLLGTFYTVISASAGLAISFLISRYTLRDLMLEKFGKSDAFIKIDKGVKEQGWRILVITRLMPVFPFSLSNYIYGLTDIKFLTYWILSTLFIIPGTAAYTMSAGAVLSGEFSTKNLIYLGIGAVCFVGLSFIPQWLKAKDSNSQEKL